MSPSCAKAGSENKGAEMQKFGSLRLQTAGHRQPRNEVKAVSDPLMDLKIMACR